jgi:hypothetical protein
MNLATEMGRLSGRATPSLQDGPSRQSNETGRRSTYLLPIAVQTNRATSQIRRTAHRAHHLIKLVLSIAVPVDEAGKITVGERGLLMGDRIERDGRIGNDPRAVPRRDRAVLLDAFCFKPAPFHARGGGPDLVLWLKANALRFQAAMIDPRIDIELGQPESAGAPDSSAASA